MLIFSSSCPRCFVGLVKRKGIQRLHLCLRVRVPFFFPPLLLFLCVRVCAVSPCPPSSSRSSDFSVVPRYSPRASSRPRVRPYAQGHASAPTRASSHSLLEVVWRGELRAALSVSKDARCRPTFVVSPLPPRPSESRDLEALVAHAHEDICSHQCNPQSILPSTHHPFHILVTHAQRPLPLFHSTTTEKSSLST